MATYTTTRSAYIGGRLYRANPTNPATVVLSDDKLPNHRWEAVDEAGRVALAKAKEAHAAKLQGLRAVWGAKMVSAAQKSEAAPAHVTAAKPEQKPQQQGKRPSDHSPLA